MKIQILLKKILEVLSEWVREKRTGSLVFRINFSQGGIGKSCIIEEKETAL